MGGARLLIMRSIVLSSLLRGTHIRISRAAPADRLPYVPRSGGAVAGVSGERRGGVDIAARPA
jgi:hypothetical protein